MQVNSCVAVFCGFIEHDGEAANFNSLSSPTVITPSCSNTSPVSVSPMRRRWPRTVHGAEVACRRIMKIALFSAISWRNRFKTADRSFCGLCDFHVRFFLAKHHRIKPGKENRLLTPLHASFKALGYRPMTLTSTSTIRFSRPP